MSFRRALRVMGLLALPLGALASCSDFGEPANTAPLPVGGPVITDLVPLRTFPGDTVLVQGAGFGVVPGEVLFESTSLRAADVSATIVTWEDDRIRVLVPGTVAPGDVTVRVDEEESNAIAFDVATEISYSADVEPLFSNEPVPTGYGCWGCHAFGAAEAGFTVYPYSSLISSTAIIPRRSASSRLRQRLLPSTPVDQRMPKDGPYMTDAQILRIADWIDQGARDN